MDACHLESQYDPAASEHLYVQLLEHYFQSSMPNGASRSWVGGRSVWWVGTCGAVGGHVAAMGGRCAAMGGWAWRSRGWADASR